MSTAPEVVQPQSWWQTISRYQWIVLLTCYMGGLFDGLDSSLFTVALPVAMKDLLHTTDTSAISQKGAIIAAMFLVGWTVGGLIFGMLADKIGRVKALSLSILIYALCTGLCGFAQTWEQLAFFRMLTAIGIGGELIVGATLLAESWPEHYRARAVGFLTTAYQGGVILVGLANLYIGQIDWRYLFFVGALPALLVMAIRRRVEEPERWQKLDELRKCTDKDDPAVSSCFTHLFQKEYRKNLIVASTFTGALLVAYWASSFWIPAWVHQLLGDKVAAGKVASYLLMLQGGFAIGGCISGGFLAEWIGRRWTLILANGGYLVTSIGMFWLNQTINPAVYVWGSLMGIFIGMTISICYIYVGELFPTRLRATATGCCFNLGRLFAAVGVIFSSQLVSFFGGSYAMAALALSTVLLSAIIAAPFAPETKGKALLD